MTTAPLITPDITREEDLEQVPELEKLYRVLVHNDDVTPYDFVIVALVRFFRLDPYQAELITWAAHNSGNALVAVLPLSDAQQKVGQAHFAAGLEGYPLTFSIEPE
jgi:ATP-dependent Clp protease adaptor protein ClpS